MNDLYTFVYRGVLADESLNRAGRQSRNVLGPEDGVKLRTALSFNLLDAARLDGAERMAVVYTAIHAFENMVRDFVQSAMAEEYKETWWEHVPERLRTRAQTRMEQEAKFRWHGARGGSEIEYLDFGDLSSIITVNWSVFEDLLSDLEWTKSTLSVLERSRNIVMHGGTLARQDVERIGMNIRDWVRQTG